jgi:hypothetical protein
MDAFSFGLVAARTDCCTRSLLEQARLPASLLPSRFRHALPKSRTRLDTGAHLLGLADLRPSPPDALDRALLLLTGEADLPADCWRVLRGGGEADEADADDAARLRRGGGEADDAEPDDARRRRPERGVEEPESESDWESESESDDDDSDTLVYISMQQAV